MLLHAASAMSLPPGHPWLLLHTYNMAAYLTPPLLNHTTLPTAAATTVLPFRYRAIAPPASTPLHVHYRYTIHGCHYATAT